MAEAKKCDRCGVYYAKSNHNCVITRGYWFEGPGNITWDLCDKCADDLDIFMNGAKVKDTDEYGNPV